MACLAALATGAGSRAHADLWAYLDETGRASFATSKLDQRYQLFLRGGTSVEGPGAASDAASVTRAEFERNPVFLRMAERRNVDRFQALIDKHAALQQLDPALVKAVIAVESSFEPSAVSAKAAIGLMQIIPQTGQRYGVRGDARGTIEQKLLDPAINLSVGTRYLRDLMALFANDLDLVLAAYNAGEQAVIRYGNAIPPYAETREYVTLVQQFLAAYQPKPPASANRVRVVIPGRRGALILPPEAAR